MPNGERITSFIRQDVEIRLARFYLSSSSQRLAAYINPQPARFRVSFTPKPASRSRLFCFVPSFSCLDIVLGRGSPAQTSDGAERQMGSWSQDLGDLENAGGSSISMYKYRAQCLPNTIFQGRAGRLSAAWFVSYCPAWDPNGEPGSQNMVSVSQNPADPRPGLSQLTRPAFVSAHLISGGVEGRRPTRPPWSSWKKRTIASFMFLPSLGSVRNPAGKAGAPHPPPLLAAKRMLDGLAILMTQGPTLSHRLSNKFHNLGQTRSLPALSRFVASYACPGGGCELVSLQATTGNGPINPCYL